MSATNINSVLFSEPSPCSQVLGNVELISNTWEQHINIRHPEVKTSESVRLAIANPSYVAKSKAGPNGKNADNLVFVSDISRIRKARLHVFVESPKHSPRVSTAMYSTKPHHDDIVWSNDVQVSYDESADVLYISKQNAQEALSDEQDDGLLFRYALTDEKPCGVTVPLFHKAWWEDRRDLAAKISEFLNVPLQDTERAIASVG